MQKVTPMIRHGNAGIAAAGVPRDHATVRPAAIGDGTPGASPGVAGRRPLTRADFPAPQTKRPGQAGTKLLEVLSPRWAPRGEKSTTCLIGYVASDGVAYFLALAAFGLAVLVALTTLAGAALFT
ncbi:MAG: hypothetical protein KGM46_02330, partial [Pseudomonadota bacterium]|nr:hypothetical protein [Pseudomonadota bacterium]